MKIKKDDMVVVISGKDNYKNSKEWQDSKKVTPHKVLVAEPKTGKLIIEGVSVATKHQKPQGQGKEGGIIRVETPIYASKVMLYCSRCKKGVRTGCKVADGKKTRVCKKCGAEI